MQNHVSFPSQLLLAAVVASVSFNAINTTIMKLLLLLLCIAEMALAVDFLVTSDGNDPANTEQHFVARILDDDIVEEARAEIGKPDGWKIISGTIDKTPVDWNPGWSFHLTPETVFFGEVFFEVCDATVDYVEENLEDAGGAFLPGLQWCPWGTRVLEELPEGGVPSPAPVDMSSMMPSVADAIVESSMPSGVVAGATLMPTEEPTSSVTSVSGRIHVGVMVLGAIGLLLF